MGDRASYISLNILSMGVDMTFSMKTTIAAIGFAVSATFAGATTTTVYDGVTAGSASFDATVAAAGGTVNVDTWTALGSGTSVDRGDYVITRNNGGRISGARYGTLSGQAISINPRLNRGASQPSGGRANPMDYFDSGVTLTFDSAVNSVGFEIGDWATCCHAPTTDLFISFDGGTPIQVASASGTADGRFPSQTTGRSVYEIFVAAFDDTGDFTTVSFWGNGIGEYLLLGGQVRYALIDQGSLPSSVPLPAGGLLLIGGLGGLVLTRRRKS